jgi:hypothetical protein
VSSGSASAFLTVYEGREPTLPTGNQVVTEQVPDHPPDRMPTSMRADKISGGEKRT